MIKIDSLSKRFGALTAVDDLSFTVEPGEVLGFLGPNGAGKSTTMKMITGFLMPTGGTVTVSGFDVSRQPVKAKACMGYLPEGAPAYGEMTPLSFLNFVAELRGLKGALKRRRVDEMVDLLHLQPVIDKAIDTLSKGFKRRVGVAQALIHDPEVLILDEPTDGLDPNQKHEVRTLIENMAKDKLVVVSTHILEEVTAICSRAIIINQGKLIADEKPHELQARSRFFNAITLHVKDADKARRALAEWGSLEAVEDGEEPSQLILFPRDRSRALPLVEQILAEQRDNIEDFRVESGRLDDVFRQLTREVSE